MYAVSSVKQSNDAWATALAIATQLSDTDYRLRSLRALWAEGINSGRFNEAHRRAIQFRDLAHSAGTAADQILSDRLIGTALHFMGDHPNALQAVERMLQKHDDAVTSSQLVRFQFNQKVSARIVRGRILWLQGRIDSALRDIEENVEEALSLDHAMSLCNVLTQAACPIAILSNEYELARRYVSLLHKSTAPRAFDIWHTYAVCFDAEMEIDHGNVENGLKRLSSSIRDLRGSDFGHNLTMFTIAATRGLIKLDRINEAHAALEEAEDICERNGERWSLPELFRTKGELLARAGRCTRADGATAMFMRSVDAAREQDVPMLELRAAVSMLKCSRDFEARNEAEVLIHSILRKFDEGLTRPALVEARALIDAHLSLRTSDSVHQDR